MSARRFAVFVATLLVPLSACKASGQTAATGAELKSEDDKTLYALGLMMGGNLKPLRLTPEELAKVKQGLDDSVSGAKPQVELEAYGPKFQQFAQGRVAAGASVEKEKGKTFAEAAAKEEGATRTPSGLVFRSLAPGKGASPSATSKVKVNYEGSLMDGTVFDSSIKRGQPAEFALNGVIPCWSEALQKMKVGEKAKIVCPADIAYGDRGHPPQIPGGATLVFQVELLDVAAEGAPAPPVTAPPVKK